MFRNRYEDEDYQLYRPEELYDLNLDKAVISNASVSLREPTTFFKYDHPFIKTVEFKKLANMIRESMRECS